MSEIPMLHVDDWLDNSMAVVKADNNELFARMFLELFRMKATQSNAYINLLVELTGKIPTCKYIDGHDSGEQVYRITGCSRFGDVWLRIDHNSANGYDIRANIAKCHSWEMLDVRR